MSDIQYVVIVEHSAGNDSVSEMWKETKVFGPGATIHEVMKWALKEDTNMLSDDCTKPSRKNVILTRADPPK